jgi:hypothetical protein
LGHFERTGWGAAHGILGAEEVEAVSAWMGEFLARPEVPSRRMVNCEVRRQLTTR